MQKFTLPLMQYVYSVVFHFSLLTLRPLDRPVFARRTADILRIRDAGFVTNTRSTYLLTYSLHGEKSLRS